MKASPTIEPVAALHLLPHQGVGGLQRFVIELVRHERMDRTLHEIVLTERPLDVDGDFMAPATPAHFLGLADSKVRTRAQRLADLAKSRGARALQVYRARDLDLAVEAKRRSKGTLRIITQFFDRPDGPAGLYDGFLGRRRLRSDLAAVDVFFVASPALVRPWSQQSSEPGVRLPAVDVQRFHPQHGPSAWRQARLPDPETLLVGSLMRAVPSKGQDVLMAAVEQRHAAGRPTALMLVGDGPRYGALRERGADSECLFVRRRVLDGPGFFGQIDALALHSATELIPMALIEALACGRAATVADPGGVGDLVGQDAALFTAPNDVDAVIAALDQLADAEYRQQLGEAGRQRALDRHNLGNLRSKLAATYTA